MSVLNDRDLMKYGLREALTRESHMIVKIKTIYKSTRDKKLRNLCLNLLASGDSRLLMLKKEMKNHNIN